VTGRPSKRPLSKAPGHYRSRYRTAACSDVVWFDLVNNAGVDLEGSAGLEIQAGSHQSINEVNGGE